MKKKFFDIPVYYFVILGGLGMLLWILGTFFDWQVSSAIADTSNWLGVFNENFGMAFGFMMIPFGATLICKGLYKNKHTGIRILGYNIAFLGLFMGTFLAGSNFYFKDGNQFALNVGKYPAYIIGFILSFIAMVLAMLILSSEDKSYLIRLGTIILLTMVIQYLIIYAIKDLAARPRYRYIITDSLHPDVEVVFKNWYEFAFAKPASDSFKSFPSGHTGTAGVFFLFPAICPVLKFKAKWIKPVIYAFTVITTMAVIYSRVRCGAHYISDVGFALLAVSIVEFVQVLLGTVLFRNIQREKDDDEGEDKNEVEAE